MAHRRAKVGVGKVSGTPHFSKKAEEIKINSLNAAVSVLQQLQTKLEDFAHTYQQQLREDPAFRHKFFQMCAPLGIDALCSTSKKNPGGGFWSRLFHDTSGSDVDFYNELSVKVAEVCIASRLRNGGIISVSEVRDILGRRKRTFSGLTIEKDESHVFRQKNHLYSTEEIVTAVSKLSVLGSIKTVTIGQGVFIQSVPAELDNDHYQVLNIAQVKQGHVTVTDIMNETRWGEERANRAMNLLLSEGMAWLDVHDGTDHYWFPRYVWMIMVSYMTMYLSSFTD